jgi:type IV pilus assembly protein PilW
MKSSQKGFTLVEIMVAMVIGMIGVLVIMQVARTTETQKRITAGTGSAQDNGTMGIYMIQRDVKQAGYGFTSIGVLGCPVTIPASDPLGVRNLAFLAPVVINSRDVPAGDAGTDTLLVAYGSSAGSPEGDTINAVTGQQIGVMSTVNFKVGEYVVVAPMTPKDGCTLTLGAITALSANTVTVPGVGAAGALIDASVLLDLGPLLRIAGYAVRNGSLTTCDYLRADCGDAANWTIIADGIVSLLAQYGRDDKDPRNGSVDTWDWETPTLNGSQEQFASDWARIAAVQLALVARNGEPAGAECAHDATRCPTRAAPSLSSSWANTPDTPNTPDSPDTPDNPPSPDDSGKGAAKIDLSANSDWRHYRYQVYEAVIPLRNIPWMGVP